MSSAPGTGRRAAGASGRRDEGTRASEREKRKSRLPLVLGGAPEDMSDLDYLKSQRVRIALQGHAPFAAATQAVYQTLKALREGASPKQLKDLASSELMGRVTREADTKARIIGLLGLKP